jgi:hypothetical protein
LGETKFQDEACTSVTLLDAAYSRPPHFPANLAQDLRHYLSRPVVFRRGVFNSTVYGSISTGDINSASMLTYFPSLTRAQGAYGFRATIVLRLEIQATPFQAGLLKLAWVPEYSTVSATTYNPFSYLATVSQLPGVVMDINETTSVILRIPYVNSLDYWFVNSGAATITQTYDVGTWALWALTPLSTPASATAPNWALWTSLEDIEFIGLAPANAGVTYSTLAPQLRHSPAATSGPIEVQPQAGTQATESMKPSSGPISSVLAATSRIVSFAGSAIPLISSYTGPTAWMLRVGAMLASAFGWSKPLNTAAVKRVITTTNNYQHNCDAHDTSWNLGLFSDNQVAVMPGFAGSNVDEMAIDYIVGVPAIINYATFSTTNVVGDTIFNIAISPMAMYFQLGSNGVISLGVDSTFSSFLPSPVMYVANCFQYWSGDFKFKFRLAKTKFHSGRLLVAHIPFWYPSTGFNTGFATPVQGAPMNFKSHIWDLKDSNDYEFTVPYTFIRPFASIFDVLGSLSVTVEQPLLAPSSVGTTLSLVVEVEGLPGFTFGTPISPQFLPGPLIPKTVTPQSGEMAAYSFGESIMSVKQLMLRMGVTLAGYYVAAGVFYPSTYTPSISAPTSITYTTNSYLNYFAPAYAYVRGSTRYTLQALDKTIRSTVILINGSRYSTVAQVTEGASNLHFIMPYYNYTNRTRLVGIATNGTTTPVGESIITPTTANHLNWVSAADDLQLGYFLSAPPLQRIWVAPASTNVDAAWLTAMTAAIV